MTINELKKHCEEEIAAGNGDRIIILANSVAEDPEDFCTLEGGFSSPVYNSSGLQEFLEDNDIPEANAIVLN